MRHVDASRRCLCTRPTLDGRTCGSRWCQEQWDRIFARPLAAEGPLVARVRAEEREHGEAQTER